MKTYFKAKNNPRVIIIQKLYGKFYNEDIDLNFPKHRFRKFIKDIVLGTIERNDLILDQLNNTLGDQFIFKKWIRSFKQFSKLQPMNFCTNQIYQSKLLLKNI